MLFSNLWECASLRRISFCLQPTVGVEPFSKWGAQVIVKNLYKIFVVWIRNYDVTSIERWRH